MAGTNGPLATYNSLMDRHLAGYFCNQRRRRHLVKSGLITKRGEVISENTYRLNMARNEHKNHVKDLLAQAIVHKALDWERTRQVKIKQKLEEISKIELVRRVKADCNRQGDEEILPYLTPRGTMVDGSPRARHGDNSPRVRPGLRPASRMADNDGRMETGIMIDEEGCPICKRDDSASTGNNQQQQGRPSSSKRSKYPKGEIDSRNLYALDNVALYEYNLARLEKTNEQGRVSTYLTPVISVKHPRPPSQPRTPRSERPHARAQSAKPQRPASASEKKGYLHRPEPPMAHPDDIRSGAEVTMKYYGESLNLSYEVIGDPRHHVLVEQQPFGGNTLIAFKKPIMPGDTFSFISTRHRGFPFSLTFYVNGVQNARLSACCEFKHKPGSRIGGKSGHFGVISASGGIGPCYKCMLDEKVKEKKKGKKKKPEEEPKDEEKEEKVEHKDPEIQCKVDASDEESEGEKYDDDFEDDDEKSRDRAETPSGKESDRSGKDNRSSRDSSNRQTPVPVSDGGTENDRSDKRPKSRRAPVDQAETDDGELSSPVPGDRSPLLSSSRNDSPDNSTKPDTQQPQYSVAVEDEEPGIPPDQIYESEPESLNNRPVSTSGDETTREYGPTTDEESDPVEDFPREGSVLSMVGDKRDIDISDVQFSKKQVNELADIIKSRDSIVSIVLRNTNLADDSQTICDAIRQSPSQIKMLNLNRNKISSAGIAHVTEVLRQKCESLEMLLLHGNPFGDAGIEQLADTISDLHNGRNSPHLLAAKRVVKGVLEELNTSLEGSENGCQLRHLDVGDTKITSQGAYHLARIIALDTRISSLSLTGSTLLGSKGWKTVSESLVSNSNLKKLSADYSGVKDVSVEVLCQCLKNHAGIECLDLEGNSFSDRGACALLDLINTNPNVRKMKLLPGNSISDRVLDDIQDALRH